MLKSHGFNPLANLRPESDRFADDAANMARAIIKTDAKAKNIGRNLLSSLVKGLLMPYAPK